MFEILIACAILGITAGIGVFGFRAIAQGQESAASLRTLQQAVWQGATSAASRGREVELVKADQAFTLREVASGTVLRSFELSDDVDLVGVENGVMLSFTPPGRVEAASLAAFGQPYAVADGGKHRVTVSVIGEVYLEEVRQ